MSNQGSTEWCWRSDNYAHTHHILFPIMMIMRLGDIKFSAFQGLVHFRFVGIGSKNDNNPAIGRHGTLARKAALRPRRTVRKDLLSCAFGLRSPTGYPFPVLRRSDQREKDVVQHRFPNECRETGL